LKSIAIDFGGTRIKLALFDDGVIVKKASIPAFSENGLAQRLRDTEDAIRKMLSGDNIRDYAGIGISTTGAVDPVTKRISSLYGKNEDASQINLSAWCENAFGLPMAIETDSKLALLGEINFGCGKGYRDAVILTFGTGIGTAVMIGGKLLSSRNNVAGTLSSHIIVDTRGRKCTCPNIGCMEASACGWALEELAREHTGFVDSGLATEEKIDFRALEKWYVQGDRTAAEIVKHSVEYWRAGILNMIHAYDPALVILGGGVMKFQGLYEMLTEGLSERIWDCCGNVETSLAEHPEDCVLYGLYHIVCGQ